jgi:hypothetical protein
MVDVIASTFVRIPVYVIVVVVVVVAAAGNNKIGLTFGRPLVHLFAHFADLHFLVLVVVVIVVIVLVLVLVDLLAGNAVRVDKGLL